MKFLVDAHLPRKLTIQLKDMGYDTRHTLGLPLGIGNIRNDELKALFSNNMERIQAGFAEFRFIELTHDRLIFHV